MLVFILLTVGAYVLGALPLSYFAARLRHGIDLTKFGTGQAGAGNLWRMTSWKLAMPIGIFDLVKGAAMVWVAQSAGQNLAQQVAVGLAAIVGHNWSCFLRFSGGRGVSTAAGVILILPLINHVTNWGIVAFAIIIVVGSVTFRASPLAVLFGIISVSIVSWALADPPEATLGYLAILLIVITKRLTARPTRTTPVGRKQLLINRLFFDRDIRDKRGWMYRKPAGEESKRGKPPANEV